MANLKRVVSFIVSHPRNKFKFKGTFATHSSLLPFRNTSSFLEVGSGICLPKTISAPFYSTLCYNRQNLLNNSGSMYDNDQQVCEYSYNIERLCRLGLIDDAIAMLDKMVGLGCKPNVATYTTIFDSLFKMGGMEDSALKLFREMALRQGIQPDGVVSYSSFLHVVRMLCRRDDMSKLLKDMEDKGIYVGVRTFNIFVDAYCKEGRMEDAECLVKLMIQRRLRPDVVTYELLIDGYCLQGQMVKAREVFDTMRCSHKVPDVAVYHSLLNGYFKDSNVEEAMNLFDVMMKNGVNLNAIIYDTNGLFRYGHCTAKQEFFNEVPIPDECTFNIVFEGLCNNNRVEEAVSLFHSMGDNKLNSSIALYNALIDGASKNGNLGIARTLYNDMTVVKGLQPNAETYAAMINGFFQEGLAGEAKELFLEMKQKGFLPNNVTCDLLLQGFLKNQQLDIAVMLLHEMVGRGFVINVPAVLKIVSDHASL